METKNLKIVANYQLKSIVREVANPKVLILLLHGYSQRGSFIYKKLVQFLPECAEVHAPTAPFPLLSNHPLSDRPKNKQLISGNAWYFYDAARDFFYIPYDIPVEILNNYLQINNPKHLPVIVIGYSQGGYLLPFLALKNKNILHIIGVNCSYRIDMFQKELPVKADAINGKNDQMVDPILAARRQEKLFGEFVLLENESHFLTTRFGTEVHRLLQQSPCLD